VKIFDLLGNQYTRNEPMRVIIFGDPGTGVIGENGEHLEAGQEHTVSDHFGQLLVGANRARRVGGAPTVAPDQVQTRDPQPTNREPKTATRKRSSRKKSSE
jgi:hypothetical protein